MREHLEKMLDGVRCTRMTPEEMEQQRRSFAFGNVSIANPMVTREVIDQAADAMGSTAVLREEVAALRERLTELEQRVMRLARVVPDLT